jgi:nucleoside-triphosphatase THEP1
MGIQYSCVYFLMNPLLRYELILWTGKKHSGKTTAVAKLVKIASSEGFEIAGVLAPSVYHNGRLVGFDALDLQDKTCAPLARRKINGGKNESFTFIASGLKHGYDALSAGINESVDIIIIDEFGPLELNGEGWRKSADSLMSYSNILKLFVVRLELADVVQRLYKDIPCLKLAANESKSIDKVIRILGNRRLSKRGGKCSSLTEC